MEFDGEKRGGEWHGVCAADVVLVLCMLWLWRQNLGAIVSGWFEKKCQSRREQFREGKKLCMDVVKLPLWAKSWWLTTRTAWMDTALMDNPIIGGENIFFQNWAPKPFAFRKNLEANPLKNRYTRGLVGVNITPNWVLFDFNCWDFSQDPGGRWALTLAVVLGRAIVHGQCKFGRNNVVI